MRNAAFLLFLLVAISVPSAGHGGADGEMFRLQVAPTTVYPTATAFDLTGVDGVLRSGDLLVASFSNGGPDDITVGVEANLTDHYEVIDEWTVPGDQEIHVFSTRLPYDADYAFNVSAAGDRPTSLMFFFDHPCACPSTFFPFQLSGGKALMSYTAQETGTHKLILPEPAAHNMRIDVYEDDGGTLDTMPLLATSTKGSFDAKYDITTHKLQFEAEAGKRYFATLTATKDLAWDERTAAKNVVMNGRTQDILDPFTVVGMWSPGAVEQSPMPLWAGLAAIGLAFAARRR